MKDFNVAYSTERNWNTWLEYLKKVRVMLKINLNFFLFRLFYQWADESL